MTQRVYARLDRNRMGPLLTLDDSDLIVTTTDACNYSRTILGSIPALSGTYYFEVYFYSQSRGDLTTLCSLGVAGTSYPLNTQLGLANSVAFLPANGAVFQNSLLTSTYPKQAERVCLSALLSLSPSLCTVTFAVDGAPIATATLPNGLAWLPGISLGGATPGDISASVSFGSNRFDNLGASPLGWSQQAAGLAPINISLATEAFTDTATTTAYDPTLLNADAIAIKWAPVPWFQRGDGGTPKAGTSATLNLDNSEGHFNALYAADVRDSPVAVSSIDAPAGGVGSGALAQRLFTGILDEVTEPDASTTAVVLRGTLSRFDVGLQMRVVPPFYDESAAGIPMPIGIGSQRNITPILLDEPNRLYLFGDAPSSTVGVISDGGERLDPYAATPQYTPAFNGAGVQLDTLPQKRLAADVSSVGPPYVIPGNPDLLGGLGAFTTWSGGVPSGWVKPTTGTGYPASVVSATTIAQDNAYPTAPSVYITSQVGIATNQFGAPLIYNTALLQPGSSYRITFTVLAAFGDTANGSDFGVIVLSKYAPDSKYWITPWHQCFRQPGTYSFVYTVPRDEPAPLKLIVSLVSSTLGAVAPTTFANATVDTVICELLGTYVAAPLVDAMVSDALTEILVKRKGELPAIFSAADAAAIDTIYGPALSLRWTDAPNILDVLNLVADQYGAVLFEDENGVVRIRQLTDPAGRPVVAAFSKANIEVKTFKRWRDKAEALTTNYGCRPNCDPFASGDFVTDTIGVPATIRAQYQGASQILFSTNSVPLAQEYQHAYNAPRNHLRFDDEDIAALEARRVTSLYKVPRNFVSFDAYYEGNLVGLGPSIAPRAIYYNDVVTLDLPEKQLITQPMACVAKVLSDSSKRINITGWF